MKCRRFVALKLMNIGLVPLYRIIARSVSLLLAYPLWFAAYADGQTNTYSFTGLNYLIPDGSASGITDVQTLTGLTGTVANVTVSLDIEGVGDGAFNGDLYVYLQHDGVTSILLNRTGRTASNPFGYGDNGFNVTFADGAVMGDIHGYRVALNGNPAIPISPSPLKGIWEPDGRSADPGSVFDTSPRTKLLSGFEGLQASGMWSLFVADLDTGGTAQIDSWSLSINAVPEPVSCAAVVGVCLLAFASLRRNAP
jgi:subtilisin-like proprotein convertase family protein